MRRLTAIDAQFLYAEELRPAAHQHTIKASIIDPTGRDRPYSFEGTKETLRRRLHRLPPFRWRLVRTPFELHHPMWIEDPDFDLDFHVRRVACPAPGGVQELCELISEIASRPLDRRKPLWELYMVEGLEGGRIASVAKVHHALADGVASAELLDLVYDLDPTAAEQPPTTEWQPDKVPSKLALAIQAVVEVVRLLAEAVPRMLRLRKTSEALKKEAAESGVEAPPKAYTAPTTPFNRALTPHRNFTLLTIPLEEVRRVKSVFGTTINDVVLATAAGGLRRYLTEKSALPATPLVGAVPVSTRTDDERLTWGNKLAVIYVNLPTDVADPVERLHVAHRYANAAKAELERTRGRRLENWIEVWPLPVLRALGKLLAFIAVKQKPSANVTVSNVPGPRQRLHINGAPIESFFSVGPLTEAVGLNMTAWSYVEQMNVSFLACKEAIPDLWHLTDCVRQAFEELCKAATEQTQQEVTA